MSLIKEISDYRVSSVLNGDRKMYGKKYLFDGNDETCWNSDQGSPQWIEFNFKEPRTITKLRIQFQGGFAAKRFDLEPLKDVKCNNSDAAIDSSTLKKCSFHPLDTNQMQEFLIEEPFTSQRCKMIFNSSFDFYGRITIYCLDVIGD